MTKDNYYGDFIRRNRSGIIRLDPAAPLDPARGAKACVRDFTAGAVVGECNPAAAAIFERIGAEIGPGTPLAALAGVLEILAAPQLTKFFENGRRLDDWALTVAGTDGAARRLQGRFDGVEDDGRLVAAWLTIEDVTAEYRRRQNADEIEKHWRLTQKIEALGRLAGGIAHDFNNFLAVMMLQNDMLNLQLPAGSPLRYRTEEMKKATNKAAATVKQLLAVGRKQTLNPKPTEINAVVTEFSKLLATFVGDRFAIETVLGENAGVCFVDQAQLIQSLMSLAENSRDAMPDGGTLTIATAGIVLDKSSILHKSQPEGSFVEIVVTDTGVGMDAATLESVFEPFFSTKKSTKGVGLGLATVYGFVKQSKGFIWVESETGRGTTFRIQFPRIDQPPRAA